MHTLVTDIDKGGQGKTKTAASLAQGLYGAGKRVVVFGNDNNRGITFELFHKRMNTHAANINLPNNQDLIGRPEDQRLDWRQACIPYDPKGDRLAKIQAGMPSDMCRAGGCLDVITESRDLADVYDTFKPSAHVATISGALPYWVRQIEKSGLYDYCIIDNSPGWDPVAKGALYASRWVIAPIEAAPLSLDSLEEYAERIDKANEQRRQAGLSGKTEFFGILPSRFKGDISIQEQLLHQLPEKLAAAGLPMFSANGRLLMVPETNAVLGASVTHLPAWATEPQDPGAQALLSVVRYVLHKLG